MKNRKTFKNHPWSEASTFVEEWCRYGCIHAYIASAETIEIEKEKILLLHFYPVAKLSEGIVTAEFRVFQTQGDYITEQITDGKSVFTTGSIRHRLSMHYWKLKDVVRVLLPDQIKVIEEFIAAENELYPMDLIYELQSKIQTIRLDKKHKKITDVIDKAMEYIEALPEDFDNWVKETAMHFSRYIFYTYEPKRKIMDGVCTYCGQTVKVANPKHNHQGVCPSCLSDIQYKAAGKTTRHNDRANAAVFQKYEDGFIVRHFRIYREFEDHFSKPKTTYRELRRDFFNVKLVHSDIEPYWKTEKTIYEYEVFKQTGVIRWCNNENKIQIDGCAVYSANLDEILTETRWKYSALKKLVESQPGFQVNLYYFFERSVQYPFIEYLIKLGLYNLANGICSYSGSSYVNRSGKSLEEILRINKVSLKTLQQLNGDEITLATLQYMEKAEIILPNHLIHEIALKIGDKPILFSMAKHTTIYKVLKYLKAQKKSLKYKKENQGCWMSSQYRTTLEPEKYELHSIFKDYMDYIRFCDELGYDLSNEFVLFPRDMKSAHDETYKLLMDRQEKERNAKRRKLERKFQSMAPEFNKKYGLKHKDMILTAPKSAKELTNEGQTLHHCVSTYMERIVAGHSVVMFIRKVDDPQKPFCTIEVIDGKVTQCRGKNNKDMRDQVAGLLKKLMTTKLQKAEETNVIAM